MALLCPLNLGSVTVSVDYLLYFNGLSTFCVEWGNSRAGPPQGFLIIPFISFSCSSFQIGTYSHEYDQGKKGGES